MATFAVIIDGIVDNIIVADSKEIAENVTGKTCVEYVSPSDNAAFIGLGFDAKTGKFEQPSFNS